jgi:tetratricopeptide (TPR) repeat protein
MRAAARARYDSAMASEAARARLRQAMALHSADDIDAALTAAREAISLAPNFGEAHAYLGNTLVTRRRRFADGLEALERAAELLPRDPTVLYTLGWCMEFVAHALDRPRGAHQPVERDAATLYAQARAVLLRARQLDPDDGLRGDIEDILDVIAAATGEPWDEVDSRRSG